MLNLRGDSLKSMAHTIISAKIKLLVLKLLDLIQPNKNNNRLIGLVFSILRYYLNLHMVLWRIKIYWSFYFTELPNLAIIFGLTAGSKLGFAIRWYSFALTTVSDFVVPIFILRSIFQQCSMDLTYSDFVKIITQLIEQKKSYFSSPKFMNVFEEPTYKVNLEINNDKSKKLAQMLASESKSELSQSSKYRLYQPYLKRTKQIKNIKVLKTSNIFENLENLKNITDINDSSI